MHCVPEIRGDSPINNTREEALNGSYVPAEVGVPRSEMWRAGHSLYAFILDAQWFVTRVILCDALFPLGKVVLSVTRSLQLKASKTMHRI